jgi:hypothetical protein
MRVDWYVSLTKNEEGLGTTRKGRDVGQDSFSDLLKFNVGYIVTCVQR